VCRLGPKVCTTCAPASWYRRTKKAEKNKFLGSFILA
jgi:hypothetical protein